jgi:ABC-2 type transport system permease protein
MPVWLRTLAGWNPVSAVTAASRTLWGNPSPSALGGVWPRQHPVLVAVAWSLLLLSVCVPLASFLFRHRTTT